MELWKSTAMPRNAIRKCKNTLNKFQIHPCLMCQIILVVLLCRTKCLQLVMMAMDVLLLRHSVLLWKFINSIDFPLKILSKFLTLFCALQVLSAVGGKISLVKIMQTAKQHFKLSPTILHQHSQKSARKKGFLKSDQQLFFRARRKKNE